MKPATEQLEKELKEKMEATLKRWQNEEEKPGDGFALLRWARKGWLVVGEIK